MRIFVDTFSKFKELFSMTFNNLNTQIQWVVSLYYGLRGEENIKNANLNSKGKRTFIRNTIKYNVKVKYACRVGLSTIRP